MARLDIPEPPFITSLSKKENETLNEWLLQIHNLLSGIGDDGSPTFDDDNIESLQLTSVTGTTDDLDEGASNTYFSGKTTDDLTEGTTNSYYTESKFSSSHASISGNHDDLKQSASDANSSVSVTSGDVSASPAVWAQAWGTEVETICNEMKADINTLVADHNDLKAKLRTANLLAT